MLLTRKCQQSLVSGRQGGTRGEFRRCSVRVSNQIGAELAMQNLLEDVDRRSIRILLGLIEKRVNQLVADSS